MLGYLRVACSKKRLDLTLASRYEMTLRQWTFTLPSGTTSFQSFPASFAIPLISDLSSMSSARTVTRSSSIRKSSRQPSWTVKWDESEVLITGQQLELSAANLH